jgi:uncharacterized protein (TIGR03067 family)
MFRTIIAVALVAFAGTLFGEEPAASEEASKLAGTYRFVSGAKHGGEASAEDLATSKVSITAKEIIATNGENQRTYVATYTLDTSKTPWRITMESLVPTIGAKAEGLVSLEGDTLKLIYALPGGETPTEFRTREKQHMWTLKAEPKPGERSKE